MVARDGIEPPTPAFSGRLPDRGSGLKSTDLVDYNELRQRRFRLTSRPIQPSRFASAYAYRCWIRNEDVIWIECRSNATPSVMAMLVAGLFEGDTCTTEPNAEGFASSQDFLKLRLDKLVKRLND